jgi:integrase
MISVKYSLRDKHAKQKSTIRTSVSYHGNRIVFCPGYSICPDCWDQKSGLPKSVRGNVDLKTTTTHLKELDLNIRRLYDDLTLNGRQKITPELFQSKILQMVHPEKYGEQSVAKITLIDFVNQFVEDSEIGVRMKDNQYQLEENTIKPYRTTRKHLIGLQTLIKKEFLLTDLNQKLHDEFSEYLISDLGMSKNAHSKIIMVLLQILKYAVKKKLIPTSILSEVQFNTSREETDNIYLNENEIELLMSLTEFGNKNDEEVRDMFVLGCYTGLRFSNYSKLDLDYIQDGILKTIQIKTKQKVTIPIHPNVRKIIDKYNGVLPNVPTNQEFNRTLKELGKKIPELNVPFAKQITRNRKKVVEETMKWEKLTTHSARRSFCTNMYLLGVPVMTIMSISGHRTEKSFRSYIKASGEEHAKIMKGFWDKQTEKNN